MPEGPVYLGYKSPNDASLPYVMHYSHKYPYKTKLMIGIRQPVHWFESLSMTQNLSPNGIVNKNNSSNHNKHHKNSKKTLLSPLFHIQMIGLANVPPNS